MLYIKAADNLLERGETAVMVDDIESCLSTYYRLLNSL